MACDLFAQRAQPVLEQRGIALVLTRLSDFFPEPQARAIQHALEAQAGGDLTPKVAFQYFSQALELGQSADVAPRQHPVALYQYTGGTTGRSKGAVLTHANLQAVLRMAEDYLAGFGARVEPGEAIVTLPPLYHIFAFNFNFLLFFRRGARNLLVPNPRPLANAQPAFERFPVRWMTGVDTLYAGLLAEPWFQANPPDLKLAVSGGTSLRPVTGERWRATVGQILEGYGLTESCCFVAFNPPGPRSARAPSACRCPAATCASPMPKGRTGARHARRAAGARPAHHRTLPRPPGETREAFVDGWFRTGDIAVMDEDGYIRIVDRKKDMVLVSGFNVYPNEVEAVIAEHPDVSEVAVIGVPDEATGRRSVPSSRCTGRGWTRAP